MNDEERRAMFARKSIESIARSKGISSRGLGIVFSEPKVLTQDQIRYREKQGLGYADLAYRGRLTPEQIQYRREHGLGFSDL